MQLSLKDQLTEFLNIIQFSEDRASFIKDFEINAHLEATVNLMDKLPKGVQELLQKGDASFIKEHISPENYREEIVAVWKKKIIYLADAAAHTLTLTQKEKIKQLLAN